MSTSSYAQSLTIDRFETTSHDVSWEQYVILKGIVGGQFMALKRIQVPTSHTAAFSNLLWEIQEIMTALDGNISAGSSSEDYKVVINQLCSLCKRIEDLLDDNSHSLDDKTSTRRGIFKVLSFGRKEADTTWMSQLQSVLVGLNSGINKGIATRYWPNDKEYPIHLATA